MQFAIEVNVEAYEFFGRLHAFGQALQIGRNVKRSGYGKRAALRFQPNSHVIDLRIGIVVTNQANCHLDGLIKVSFQGHC